MMVLILCQFFIWIWASFSDYFEVPKGQQISNKSEPKIDKIFDLISVKFFGPKSDASSPSRIIQKSIRKSTRNVASLHSLWGGHLRLQNVNQYFSEMREPTNMRTVTDGSASRAFDMASQNGPNIQVKSHTILVSNHFWFSGIEHGPPACLAKATSKVQIVRAWRHENAYAPPLLE